MPQLHAPAAFEQVVTEGGQQQKLFGHITPDTKNLAAAIDTSSASHIILIGPEGDFSQHEIALAQRSGFEGVSFGKTILRVETAGIFAAVVHAASTMPPPAI